ncbi:MAG: hypothetical protein MO853_14180 [Candidatus Protistobacter heckmanni]|nr:hypothetical protein [Candidatus Protistobacter heckmanni]MCS6764866.1 hypothetical protein [Candidatus Protistobacter heckmanni]
MTHKFKRILNGETGEISDAVVLRVEDNAFIPMDLENTDYMEYLAWIEAGNSPLPPIAPNVLP